MNTTKAIVCGYIGAPSTRRVSKEMKCAVDHVDARRGRVNGKRVRSIDTTSMRHVIRFAYTGKLQLNDDCIVYNKAKAIALASNKCAARRKLQDAGVSVPKTFFANNVLNESVSSDNPLIARTERHRGGTDIVVCKSKQDIRMAVMSGYAYFSRVYKKQREFRAHCAHGKILILQEKTGDDKQRKNLVWNHITNRFRFIPVKWSDYRVDLCRTALDAMSVIGLDYGAVDLLADSTNKGDPRCVVCEINTGPTLEGYEVERYAKYFDWLLRSDGGREHYDYKQWTVGKSFAFKNYQLGE